MPQTVKELMNTSPVTVEESTPVIEAARAMRDEDIGDVLVMNGDTLRGVLTDRDIVVRALAEGKDPNSTTVGEVCSAGEIHSVSPDDSVEDAVRLMREHAIRRLPVVEGSRPVGIISIGDLAIERDSKSALADISAAPGNK